MTSRAKSRHRNTYIVLTVLHRFPLHRSLKLERVEHQTDHLPPILMPIHTEGHAEDAGPHKALPYQLHRVHLTILYVHDQPLRIVCCRAGNQRPYKFLQPVRCCCCAACWRMHSTPHAQVCAPSRLLSRLAYHLQPHTRPQYSVRDLKLRKSFASADECLRAPIAACKADISSSSSTTCSPALQLRSH